MKFWIYLIWLFEIKERKMDQNGRSKSVQPDHDYFKLNSFQAEQVICCFFVLSVFNKDVIMNWNNV